MTAAALLDEILRLPEADRLKLLDEIWNSLDQTTVAIPEWHRQELDSRLDDPSERAEHSMDEVMARLRTRKR